MHCACASACVNYIHISRNAQAVSLYINRKLQIAEFQRILWVGGAVQQTKFTTIIKTPPPSHGATVLYVSFLFSIFLYFTAPTKLVSFARILFVHYPNIFMSKIQIFPRRLFCHIAHRFTGNSDSGGKNLHKQRQTAKSKQNEQHE